MLWHRQFYRRLLAVAHGSVLGLQQQCRHGTGAATTLLLSNLALLLVA